MGMMSSTFSLFLSLTIEIDMDIMYRYGYNVYREEETGEKRGEKEMKEEEMRRAQNSTRRKQTRQKHKQLVWVKVMDLGKGYNCIILEKFP